MNVSILALKNCIALPSIGSMELLRKSGQIYCTMRNKPQTENPFTVQIVSASENPVYAIEGYPVHCHGTIGTVKDTDLVIVPALNDEIEECLEQNKEIINWIKVQHKQGVDIASICTGAFVLAEAEILKGRNATTHWVAQDLFRKKYPDVTLRDHSIIVDEGTIITSGGATSFLNLIMYIVEKYCGQEVASAACKMFLIDMNKSPQNSYAIFSTQKSHGDSIVLHAQQIIEEEFKTEINVEYLTKLVATSRRNLERRFKSATGNTIHQYLQRVRIENAKKVLESSRTSVQEIARLVGYEDVPSFRKRFAILTGISPGKYRSRYSYFDRN